MKIYRTKRGIIADYRDRFFLLKGTDWDRVVNRQGLHKALVDDIKNLSANSSLSEAVTKELLPPIGNQEVWAAGVTYARSKQARMEESKDGGDFYVRVYEAARPELFFKALAYRTVGPGDFIRTRKDANWNVPEPELTLFACSEGTIEGYTIGNDVSSRDIEGENPLYLSQAKSYDASASVGPCLYVPKGPIDPDTMIHIEIISNGENIFFGEISINRMKRTHTELVEYLFRETSFPRGVYLMTGTGIVPEERFTLKGGDEIRISIDGIGTLINTVKP